MSDKLETIDQTDLDELDEINMNAVMDRAERKAGAAQYKELMKKKAADGDEAAKRWLNPTSMLRTPQTKTTKEEYDLDEAVTVKKQGSMVTVHDGSHQSFPLHPEAYNKIKSLPTGEKVKFKDETDRHVEAHHEAGHIKLRFTQPGVSNKTTIVKRNKLFNEEYDLDESVASDTLKPASRSVDDPKSKIEVMQRTLGAMNSMNKGDLTKWYTQAMALIGKEADSLPSGASADANASSVDMKTGKGPKTRDAMPKLSVREDVEEMFDGQELSEEFKDKASTLFEAAVNARVTVELARLDEEYENKLEEEVTEIAEALEKKLDTYLDYVVENWMKENEVAIESSLRNEIMEEFIGGLKGLFAEHYIDVPEEKIDVVEELAAKVDELEAMLDESITENAELKGMVAESKRTAVLEEMSEDLTMVQTEKFAALAEGIDFDGDVDSYKKKLSYVKETYFSKKSTPTTNIEEETFEGETTINESVKSSDPDINRLAQAISRTIKK